MWWKFSDSEFDTLARPKRDFGLLILNFNSLRNGPRLQWGTGLICSWDFPNLVDFGKRGSNGDLKTSILGATHLEDDEKYRKSVRWSVGYHHEVGLCAIRAKSAKLRGLQPVHTTSRKNPPKMMVLLGKPMVEPKKSTNFAMYGLESA